MRRCRKFGEPLAAGGIPGEPRISRRWHDLRDHHLGELPGYRRGHPTLTYRSTGIGKRAAIDFSFQLVIGGGQLVADAGNPGLVTESERCSKGRPSNWKDMAQRRT